MGVTFLDLLKKVLPDTVRTEITFERLLSEPDVLEIVKDREELGDTKVYHFSRCGGRKVVMLSSRIFKEKAVKMVKGAKVRYHNPLNPHDEYIATIISNGVYYSPNTACIDLKGGPNAGVAINEVLPAVDSMRFLANEYCPTFNAIYWEPIG